MAVEYSFITTQSVDVDENILFLNGNRCCKKGLIMHNDSSSVFRVKGVSNSCKTIYNSTRDIIDNANANSRAILDFLTQDKISTLTAENQALKFQASQTAQNAFITANQEAQTATLLRRLGAECPSPAYLVNAPPPVTFPVNGCGQVQFANAGCGCGSF